MTDQALLNTPEVEQLLTLVEEAARSTDEGIKRFIEPAQGTLRRAVSKRHHMIFGRRGSGKSSLLRKAAADLTVDRRPIAYRSLLPNPSKRSNWHFEGWGRAKSLLLALPNTPFVSFGAEAIADARTFARIKVRKRC